MKDVYVIGLFYPVVPHGTAQVRIQVSAAHSREDLEFAVKAFTATDTPRTNRSRLHFSVGSRWPGNRPIGLLQFL